LLGIQNPSLVDGGGKMVLPKEESLGDDAEPPALKKVTEEKYYLIS